MSLKGISLLPAPLFLEDHGLAARLKDTEAELLLPAPQMLRPHVLCFEALGSSNLLRWLSRLVSVLRINVRFTQLNQDA